MPFSYISLLMALMIPSLILMIALFLSFNQYYSLEKSSPFECGFDPLSNARIPFSLRFFLLAMIFLIFDIEIVLLTPSPIFFENYYILNAMIMMILFIIILIFGLIHEWNEGSLNWTL